MITKNNATPAMAKMIALIDKGTKLVNRAQATTRSTDPKKGGVKRNMLRCVCCGRIRGAEHFGSGEYAARGYKDIYCFDCNDAQADNQEQSLTTLL
ncbi:hypothetical protein [Carboxylicivirga marina]|uniref:Recombinase zinc beta ribbon domain-containing protein n=1 Tax=Carboxylicivirga marina TaxID=2800988 RepID=A0ABS1HMQ6_9BACT|nr:hypothetical protein [Carboxylicivirga marina]MBK3518911.1 hypothetical protein [Carboxylicivirga marina]